MSKPRVSYKRRLDHCYVELVSPDGLAGLAAWGATYQDALLNLMYNCKLYPNTTKFIFNNA